MVDNGQMNDQFSKSTAHTQLDGARPKLPVIAKLDLKDQAREVDLRLKTRRLLSTDPMH